MSIFQKKSFITPRNRKTTNGMPKRPSVDAHIKNHGARMIRQKFQSRHGKDASRSTCNVSEINGKHLASPKEMAVRKVRKMPEPGDTLGLEALGVQEGQS
jgi:hypothetical protein